MIKHLVQRNNTIVRFYQNSAKHSQNTPSVRLANTRLKRASDLRRHCESPAKTHITSNPKARFEPYPFKVTDENQFECLKAKVTPLIDVPYEEQLSSKESYCRNALRLFAKQLYKEGTPVRLDVNRLPCQVNSIIRSPLIRKYRNKDEYSIWRGVDGKTVVSGHMIFPVGRHGDTICVEPEGCEVTKDESIRIVKVFNDFLQNHAKLSVCYNLGEDGGWRRIIVRVNLAGELMFIGVINPRTLRVREVLEERDNFKEFMIRRCEEEGLKLASLYYQPCPHNSCRNIDVPFELLHGSRTIQETIGNFSIQVSPDSYLHSNSIGAEILYDTVRSTVQQCFLSEQDNSNTPVNSLPVIVDANCGAGVLSFNLASLADIVVGVDANPQSIDDARMNAVTNDVKNVEFVNSNLEIVLERILEKFGRQKRNSIVVCDVPSSGLHPNVAHVLRHNRDIKKLLLTVPRIGTPRTQDLLIKLCTRNLGRSIPPLAPILATPVDTCPHIEGFQTILAFERLSE